MFYALSVIIFLIPLCTSDSGLNSAASCHKGYLKSDPKTKIELNSHIFEESDTLCQWIFLYPFGYENCNQDSSLKLYEIIVQSGYILRTIREEMTGPFCAVGSASTICYCSGTNCNQKPMDVLRLVDQELKQDETENYDLFLSTAPIGTFFRNGTERILRLYCLREELRELFGFKVVPLPDPTNIEEFQAWQNDTNLSNSTTNQYFDYIDSENESMIYKDGHFSKLFIVSIVGFITTLSIFTGIFLFFYCNVKSVFKREEVFEDIETRGEEDSEHQSIVKTVSQVQEPNRADMIADAAGNAPGVSLEQKQVYDDINDMYWLPPTELAKKEDNEYISDDESNDSSVNVEKKELNKNKQKRTGNKSTKHYKSAKKSRAKRKKITKKSAKRRPKKKLTRNVQAKKSIASTKCKRRTAKNNTKTKQKPRR